MWNESDDAAKRDLEALADERRIKELRRYIKGYKKIIARHHARLAEHEFELANLERKYR